MEVESARAAPSPRVEIHGEENSDDRSTPRKDLLSAILLTVLAVAVIARSAALDRPDRLLTAPGLLPFITGVALLLMATALGWQAIRAGALRGWISAFAIVTRAAWCSAEDRHAALLGVLVLAYVVIVGHVHFEIGIATERFEILFTGFELVSIVVITGILKIFWRRTLLRCLLLSTVGVEALALAFRYGFNLIMPESF